MLSLFHDAPAIGYLGRIVGAADLIVEQLTSRVAHHAQQLRTTPKQLAGLIQLLDPGRQRSQKGREPLGPFLAVDLVVLCHGHLR